ncbi:MAG TPA: hypothetical protein VJW93_08380 [Candidatus Acidoferrales bacterium]|nr:hypothetical protein [Candidatus Acidoferrales bacterium]
MKSFKKANLIAIVAFLIPGWQLPATHSAMQSAEVAVWKTDLRDSRHTWDDLHTPAVCQATRQIAFGSNAELVVAKDSGPFAKPNEVPAWVLDAKNGKILREADWTSGSWPFLFATSTGKYAVVSQAGMALYSQGLQSAIATGTHTADKASPDGRYLSATESIPGHGVTILIDAETLKPNGTQFQDLYVWSIADNRVASSAFRGEKGVVLVKDSPKQEPEYETDCKGTRPNFITSDLLAVLGCERLDVVSLTSGKTFTSTLNGADAFFAALSRDGNRFAVIQAFTRPADPPIPLLERVTVFDVSERKPVFATDISDLKDFTIGGSSGVALSPDGSSLAINSAGVVRLFALQKGPAVPNKR